jgi:hypothetical protein
VLQYHPLFSAFALPTEQSNIDTLPHHDLAKANIVEDPNMVSHFLGESEYSARDLHLFMRVKSMQYYLKPCRFKTRREYLPVMTKQIRRIGSPEPPRGGGLSWNIKRAALNASAVGVQQWQHVS